MIQPINSKRKCADCNHSLTFNEFCRINPSISLKRAVEFWNDSMYLLFCPECYFNRPERPFRIKRRYYKYVNYEK